MAKFLADTGLCPHTRLLGISRALLHAFLSIARQVLHLDRTMLTESISAYVDRFACDWHRFSTTDQGLSRRDYKTKLKK